MAITCPDDQGSRLSCDLAWGRGGRVSSVIGTVSSKFESGQGVVVTALGVTQILAWGSSYYLPAVLANPITVATGWPLPWVVGGLSLGLLAAGLCSPQVGRAIERTGGRPVLATSSALLGLGLASLGTAPNLPWFFAAWLMIGLGMGA